MTDSIQFSDQDTADTQLTDRLQQPVDAWPADPASVLQFNEDRILWDLYTAVEVLEPKAGFHHNVAITNKDAERERFKDAYEQDAPYEPAWEFAPYEWNTDTFLTVLDVLQDATELITADTMDRYGAERLTAEHVQQLFQGIFTEFADMVRLAAHVAEREQWKQHSAQLWSMVEDDTAAHSRKRLERGFDTGNSKDGDMLHAGDVKSMWEHELERLAVEWNVEVRDVDGCFNALAERTVVVAKGSKEERLYSRREARELTVHELFHVVRAYNGITVGEKSGLPPILGLHTPHYDMTEEGGAIYRERVTDVLSPGKAQDYHLRLLAAYYLANDVPMTEIVDRLVGYGATVDRAFSLVARNREILRHHIYQGGYYEQWRDQETYWPLLMGKVNPDTAKLLQKEVEADGMLERPPVTEEQLFAEEPAFRE